jgi:hypothetical protein
MSAPPRPLGLGQRSAAHRAERTRPARAAASPGVALARRTLDEVDLVTRSPCYSRAPDPPDRGCAPSHAFRVATPSPMAASGWTSPAVPATRPRSALVGASTYRLRRRAARPADAAKGVQGRLQHWQHRVDPAGADDQIPQRLQPLPSAGIGHMPCRLSGRRLTCGPSSDCIPAVEVAVGAAVTGQELVRPQAARLVDDVAGVVVIPVGVGDAALGGQPGVQGRARVGVMMWKVAVSTLRLIGPAGAPATKYRRMEGRAWSGAFWWEVPARRRGRQGRNQQTWSIGRLGVRWRR